MATFIDSMERVGEWKRMQQQKTPQDGGDQMLLISI